MKVVLRRYRNSGYKPSDDATHAPFRRRTVSLFDPMDFCASLRRISDWRLIEENQRAALAGIVHGISRLDGSQRWGEGRTSASDGQRFAMASRVLQRTYGEG